MAFRVPESRRLRTHPILGSDPSDGNNGAFELPSPIAGWTIFVIASDGTDGSVPEGVGWEHVSVSCRNSSKGRTPSWTEMCFVKATFWEEEDVVMQLHPRRSEYVNHHPNCLHLWRSTLHPIPEPPAILVGPRSGL